jgi:malate dehydrogenase
LKKGSAFYAPSAAVAQMCRAILSGSDEVLPVCAWVSGEYGIADVYLGVPARLGSGGVEEIVELELNDQEKTQLTEAADAIRTRCADLASIG